MTDEERAADAAIYGVPAAALDDAGPSVVTINGVVASLATTEAMVHLTGLRTPKKQLTYRADHGGVRINLDPPARTTCPYCLRTMEPLLSLFSHGRTRTNSAQAKASHAINGAYRENQDRIW